MKCYLIRDLLPLYIEEDCSPHTTRAVKEHLAHCDECRSDYELMAPPLDVTLADSDSGIDKQEGLAWKSKQETTNDFLQKYYGKLIVKGTAIFLLVYIVVVLGALLIR